MIGVPFVLMMVYQRFYEIISFRLFESRQREHVNRTSQIMRINEYVEHIFDIKKKI